VPAVSPHTVSGAATGTASMLAGSEATGIPPKAGTRNGATPAWAAIVTATGSVSHAGPRSRPATAAVRRQMPPVAPTDSRNASECTSIGSASTHAATASDRSRSRPDGRPTAHAVVARAAMAHARSTDGSNRVTRAKAARTTSVAAHRPRSPNRTSSGEHRASTNATFWPDTTRRWVSPADRKSAVTTGGRPLSSPRTMPSSRLLAPSSSGRAPRSRVRRRPFATRAGGLPGDQPCTASTSNRAATWRTARRRRASSGTGRIRPATSTRSPVRRSRSTRAGSPLAHASTRRPWSRRTTRTPPRTSAGSAATTAEARTTGAGAGGGATPAHASDASPAEARPVATTSTTGSRRTSATSPSASPAATHPWP
jgi:hypothetical protein